MFNDNFIKIILEKVEQLVAKIKDGKLFAKTEIIENLPAGQENPANQSSQQNQPTPADSNEISIGDQLRQARVEKGIDFDKIFEVTKIRRRYIDCLESNDFYSLPNLLVARGYMKIYGDMLGLDVNKLIDQFNRLFPEEATGSNGPRNKNEMRIGVAVPKKLLIPKALKNMNVNSFRYAYENKTKYSRKTVVSVGSVVGFIFLAVIISNFYFKKTVGDIRNIPRQSSEVANLEAKLTPEVKQEIIGKVGQVMVQATADGKVHLTVVMDGRMIFRGNLNRGESKYWEGTQYIRIKASVPRNLFLVVNGEDVGRMSDKMNMQEETYYPLRAEDMAEKEKALLSQGSTLNYKAEKEKQQYKLNTLEEVEQVTPPTVKPKKVETVKKAVTASIDVNTGL